MTWYIVDVEADGPYPGDKEVGFSMASFGVVKLSKDLAHTFYSGPIKPYCKNYVEEAVKVHGLSYEFRMEKGIEINKIISMLASWIEDTSSGINVFVSDNPAFDWQFMNFCFHHFLGRNPFGFSAKRIGDIYTGWKRSLKNNNDWKKYRVTNHTHNALDDALGNAEALLKLSKLGMPVFIH